MREDGNILCKARNAALLLRWQTPVSTTGLLISFQTTSRPYRVAHQLALKEIALPLLSLLPCGMFGVQFIMGNRVAIS